MREVNRAIVPNFNCLFVGVSERVMHVDLFPRNFILPDVA